MTVSGVVEPEPAPPSPANAADHVRATSLSPQDFLLLDQWGRQLYEAFDNMPYLVGSVIRASRDYRDVDVRMELPDGASWLAEPPARLRAVNLSVTLWGRQVTGLPLDFQFQPDEEFHSYDGQRRGALGLRSRVEARHLAGSGMDGNRRSCPSCGGTRQRWFSDLEGAGWEPCWCVQSAHVDGSGATHV